MREEYEITICDTEEGREPFTEWIVSLKDEKLKRTVLLRIQRLRQGNFGHTRSLKDSVHELKIDIGPGLRVYFANIGLKILLLLGGGDKSTQNADIKKSKKLLEIYKQRNCL